MSSELEILAREATDLNDPGATLGHVNVGATGAGGWEVTVYVANQFAFKHCDKRDGEVLVLNNGRRDFATISERGDDLVEVVDRVLARVADAVADTPAVQVA